MALWFVLRSNDEPIGEMEIRRLVPQIIRDPDTVARYEVKVYEPRSGEDLETSTLRKGFVFHQISEGPWQLARKAVETIFPGPSPSHQEWRHQVANALGVGPGELMPDITHACAQVLYFRERVKEQRLEIDALTERLRIAEGES